MSYIFLWHSEIPFKISVFGQEFVNFFKVVKSFNFDFFGILFLENLMA